MQLRRAAKRAGAVVVLALGLQGTVGAGSTVEHPATPRTGRISGGAVEELPDLRPSRIYDVTLETTANGRTRLRFGTIGWNFGPGPLEARGARIDPDDRVMIVRQRIYRSDGTHRDRRTSAVMIYDTGDNHDHWHTRQFMTLQLYKRGVPGGNVYGMRKLGYCLIDVARMSSPPPGSPDERSYPNGSCGHSDSMKVRTGLSVGYGDDYPANYAHQWMDVTGLPLGVYRICNTIDPLGEFLEANETNNRRWTDVRINLATGRLRVRGNGIGPCGPNVP